MAGKKKQVKPAPKKSGKKTVKPAVKVEVKAEEPKVPAPV